MTDLQNIEPQALRKLIRDKKVTGHTSGMVWQRDIYKLT